MRRGVLIVLLGLVALPGVAAAQEPPPVTAPVFQGFRSVLAQGEGQQLNAVEFAGYQASGEPPETYTNQQPLYVDIMPRASALTTDDLDRFYKNTAFGEVPGIIRWLAG